MSKDPPNGSPVPAEVTESKVEATHRLQKEARWEEASRYRHAVRRRLRSEGKNKSEANEMAWNAMILAFPPIEADGDAAATDFDPDKTLRKGVKGVFLTSSGVGLCTTGSGQNRSNARRRS